MARKALIFRGGCIVSNFVTRGGAYNEHLADVAIAILSRDYKGLSNQSQNIVIEIEEVDKCTSMEERQT